MNCGRLKIDHVYILIIIFIFRWESKSCSCEPNFLTPIDAVYDSSVNKPDQLTINYDKYFLRSALELKSKLVSLYVCASLYVFFLTEMKIELFNLALAIWIFFVRKVLFQVLVFGFISHTPWFGQKTRDNHRLLCYAFKNSYFWLILFLLTENQNVLDWNPMH